MYSARGISVDSAFARRIETRVLTPCPVCHKEGQEEAELATIMAGISTKELRLEILKASWTKDSSNCSISEDKRGQKLLG